MKKNIPNQKHLTPENRNFIESSLNDNHSIKEIAYFLSKDATTISKEIKRNRVYKEPSKFGGYSNICIHRYSCTQHAVCGDSKCINQCYHCSKCNSSCTLFQPEICKVLNRAPHVCNGCKTKSACRLEKYYYRSKDAQSKYENLRTYSREGINLSEDELKELNELTVPLIKKGQPIAHIFAKHKEEIPCTSRTFYCYVEKGYLSLSNIDLRRKVRYKKRKSKKLPTLRRNSRLLVGRKYGDFITYISTNPDAKVVEMDLVEGTKGGKVLLTIFFRETKLMLIIILDDKTQQSTINAINNMENILGTEEFKKIFPLILTDNGSEFLDPILLEKSHINNDKRTSIYYCDPNCSFQKGGIEKNHEFIRYVVPKGKSFDKFSQEDINLLMNNINNTARENLNDHTPMELTKLLFSSKTIELLGLKTILPDEVCLTSQLFSLKY